MDKDNLLGIAFILAVVIGSMLLAYIFDKIRSMVNGKLLSMALLSSAKKGRVHDLHDSMLIDTDSNFSDWDSDDDDDGVVFSVSGGRTRRDLCGTRPLTHRTMKHVEQTLKDLGLWEMKNSLIDDEEK